MEKELKKTHSEASELLQSASFGTHFRRMMSAWWILDDPMDPTSTTCGGSRTSSQQKIAGSKQHVKGFD